MWIVVLIVLLLAAQLNLTSLIPLKVGQPPPPWWVGGRLLWPFALETRTLIPPGNLLNLSLLLGPVAAVCFLLAAAALFRWLVPAAWFPWLIVVGAVLSIVLQVIWFSVWAILPLLVDVALLWAVFGMRLTVAGLGR